MTQGNNYGSIRLQLATADYDQEIAAPTTAPFRRRPITAVVYSVVVAAFLVGVIVLFRIDKTQSNKMSLLLETKTPIPKENIPLFFDQAVDHFDDDNQETWSHRYYAQSKHFKGPGHPIFLIVGGEGGNDFGFFYPFVEEHLAGRFGAFCLHPEHRFYGPYIPTNDSDTETLRKLLTPQQAMADMIEIVQHYQRKLGCSVDRSSKDYCPVMTVGGSYPGFLSVIMRLLYPEVVDIGYGSSAPMRLYSQEANQFGYYDIVTSSAEKASPGCAAAVTDTLNEVDAAIRNSPDVSNTVAAKLNICAGSIPNYIDSSDLFSKEIMQIVADTFADLNMFNYNIDPSQTGMAKMCHLFQDEKLDPYEKLAEFWSRLEFGIDPTLTCFNMSSQLPTGPNASFSGSDWSGVGPGRDGMMWDFQCCTTLTPPIGFSKQCMFPYREWTLDWLTQHCRSRFDVVPTPYALLDEWKFDDLVGQGATRILFTNGGNDMWSAGGYLEDLSDSIVAVTMPNGAHHSELSHINAQQLDAKDVRRAHDEITNLFTDWFSELRNNE